MNGCKLNEDFVYEKRLPRKHEIGSQHYHNFFEIYFLEKGACNYFIDNCTYSIESGDLVLIPAKVIHKTIYGECDTIRHLIYCSFKHLPQSVLKYLPSIPYVYRNKKISRDIYRIFENIEKESRTCDKFTLDVSLELVRLLFLLITRNTDVEPAEQIGNVYTSQTISYIKAHYTEDIRLHDLASICSISPEHLSRIFKKYTGFGVSEYITVYRLQQAQSLLVNEQKLSIAEIAQQCGFNDSNYFSKIFKQSYGISPLNFRKREN